MLHKKVGYCLVDRLSCPLDNLLCLVDCTLNNDRTPSWLSGVVWQTLVLIRRENLFF